jgi:phospholipid/cholesterol/gamma-HCH transport system substrate-binding protein
MNPRSLRATATGLAVAVLATGCGLPSLTDVPLPGGAPTGPAYRITVEFADVLDLVPQAAVKVNDVTVGSVEDISLAGWTARVRLRLDRKVRLPENATAAVRQTSLLGEKFVDVAAPVTESARGRLADGALIPLSRTKRGAEIEEVLAALGLLLNGGGLAQLKTINAELAGALTGREPEAKDALRQLDAFIGGLDRQKTDIVRAVEALDRLSGRLARQREVIGGAVDKLAPGLTVLEQQRGQLTAALTSLGDLGKVGTRVVTQSRDDTVASLNALRPILQQLVQAGDALPKSLDFMLSYPFPPNANGAIVGDFMNLRITADLDAASILSNLVAAAPGLPPTATLPGGGRGTGTTPKPSTPGAGAIPKPPKVLPPGCVLPSVILPPKWTPPKICGLPPDCVLLPAGSALPLGGLLAPGGALPAGTLFPPGTTLPKGTILSPACLLPPVTGAVDGVIGGITDLLNGGLLP